MRDLLAERGLKDLSFAVVASHAADATINGLSLDRVALKRKGASDLDAQLEVARDLMIAGGAQMVYHFMSEQDVTRIMRHPRVGIASDADVLTPGEGVPHPRGYGNAARVLARYVREQRVITLEEAVRKMTSLPAAHFRFEGRGLLKADHAADIVVFDPSRVEDVATFQAPHQYAVGIPHVVVNGVPVVRDGQQTSARPGQIVTLATKRP